MEVRMMRALITWLLGLFTKPPRYLDPSVPIPTCSCGYFVFREVEHPLSDEPLRIMVSTGQLYPLGAKILRHGARPGDVLRTAMGVGPSNHLGAPPKLADLMLPDGYFYGRIPEILSYMSLRDWERAAESGLYREPASEPEEPPMDTEENPRLN